MLKQLGFPVPAAAANVLKRLNSSMYVAPNVRLRQEVRKYPLSGIRVALLNRPSVGDFTAKILEDYGAEVTKFCEPSGSFNISTKHGQKVDLNTPQDVNLIKNVARKVDILVDCLNGGRLEQAGIQPEQLLKLNSKLIVARITGYGQTGAFAARTGADATFAALSGAMSGIQSTNEESLKVARREATALTMAGRSNCVTGIILALYDREHTGRGQVVDMSVTESIAYMDRVRHLAALEIPKPFHRFYVTADDKLLSVGILSPDDQRLFLELADVSPSNDLATLEQDIASKMKENKVADWLTLFKDVGTVSEVFNHSTVGTHKQHRDRNSFEFDKQANKWIAKSVPEFLP